MIERHRLRDHEVLVRLVEVAPGRIRWSWTIDGQHARKGACTLAAFDVARSEALLYAQLAIARFEQPALSPS